jgi:hypothetical protein
MNLQPIAPQKIGPNLIIFQMHMISSKLDIKRDMNKNRKQDEKQDRDSLLLAKETTGKKF